MGALLDKGDIQIEINALMQLSYSARLRRRLLIPVFLIVFVSAAVIGGLVYGASRAEDRAALAASQHLVAAIVSARHQSLKRQVKDYSWWDTAIEKLLIKFDPEWAHETIGTYLDDNFDIDLSLALDGQDRLIFGAVGGKDIAQFNLSSFGEEGALLLRRVREQAGSDEPDPVLTIAPYGKRLILLAASVLIPEGMSSSPVSPDPRAVLVLGQIIDAAYLAALAQQYSLPGLHLVPPGGVLDRAAIALSGFDGRLLGWLTWQPGRPGHNLLAAIAPFVLLALVVMALLLWLFTRRAFDAVRRFESDARERQRAEEALDLVSMPFFSVDGLGRILLANNAAQKLLAQNDGLRLEDNAIRAWRDGEQDSLRQLIRDRADPDGPHDKTSALTSLSRPSGKRPLTVMVSPLHPPGSGDRALAAAIFVRDPEALPAVSAADLTRLFGLTPAEARVVGELLKGKTVQEVADTFALSLNTVRNHLKQAYRKTGAARQSELVVLVLSSIIAAPPEAPGAAAP